jgi:hypothetical protein
MQWFSGVYSGGGRHNARKTDNKGLTEKKTRRKANNSLDSTPAGSGNSDLELGHSGHHLRQFRTGQRRETRVDGV